MDLFLSEQTLVQLNPQFETFTAEDTNIIDIDSYLSNNYSLFELEQCEFFNNSLNDNDKMRNIFPEIHEYINGEIGQEQMRESNATPIIDECKPQEDDFFNDFKMKNIDQQLNEGLENDEISAINEIMYTNNLISAANPHEYQEIKISTPDSGKKLYSRL